MSLPARIAVVLASILLGIVLARIANILADRVSDEESTPPNARLCAKCGSALPHFGLLALHRVIWRRRRCEACGQRASLRFPLIELGVALYMPLLLLHLQNAPLSHRFPLWGIFAVDALLIGVFAFTFAADLEHHLIFDLAIYPPAALLLVVALITDHKALAAMIFGAIISGGLFLIFYGLGLLIYHQEALGFGDVTLATLVGLLVGWPGVLTALLATALGGALTSVLLLGFGSVSRRTYIPFGTFLTIGAALALLYVPPFW